MKTLVSNIDFLPLFYPFFNVFDKRVLKNLFKNGRFDKRILAENEGFTASFFKIFLGYIFEVKSHITLTSTT
jgi:hypothetical protein